MVKLNWDNIISGQAIKVFMNTTGEFVIEHQFRWKTINFSYIKILSLKNL